MEDRELLELAAKAGGFEIESWCEPHNQPPFFWMYGEDIKRHSDDDYERSIFKWNPLVDDGDALRLAVKLDIGISPADFDIQCHWFPAGQNPYTEAEAQLTEEIVNGDKMLATRKAIVKVAAEIGKTL